MVEDEKPFIVKLFLLFSFTPNRSKLSGFYLTMSFSNFFSFRLRYLNVSFVSVREI